MTPSKGTWRNMLALASAGGLAFWLANFAISRTPIAAQYRAALSISYYPMLLQALLAGLIIAGCVSYCLLRFFDRIPTRDPVSKSIILTSIVLVMLTLLMQGPASFLIPAGHAWFVFLTGVAINLLRFLALGISIGYLYKRLYKGSDPSANISRFAQAE